MSKNTIQVAPSILSGDFAHLAEEVKKIEKAGADALHIDVMDGHFVPNLTLGPVIVSAINRSTDLFLDVHLMMYNPFDYIEAFVKAGADQLTIHFEATEDVEETLLFIRRCNIKAGLAFCPETSMSLITRFLDKIDTLLLMTVHPGFSGQAFMPEVLEKIKFARDVCDRLDIRQGGVTSKAGEKLSLPPFNIQVDGGITPETAKLCYENGANSFVSGSYLFDQPDMSSGIKALRNLTKQH